jgi:hypothetical protein
VFEIGDQIVHVLNADRQAANEIAPEAVSDKTAPRSSISSWPRNGRCFGPPAIGAHCKSLDFRQQIN